MDTLPEFTYHPDPVATGSVVVEDITCVVCSQARTHRYIGPVYSRKQPDGPVCPWCIADGGAADALDAEFVDAAGAHDVAPSALETLIHRTPGYIGWQQEVWLMPVSYTHLTLPTKA